MKRLIATLILSLCSWCSTAQLYTPTQVLSLGKPYYAFSAQDLKVSQSALLSLMTYGVVVAPSSILASGAPFYALSDHDIEVAQTTLLNILAAPTRSGLLNPMPLGPTVTTAYRGNNPGYAFYDPATNGIVRDFTFVSSVGSDTGWLYSTNIEIRVFAGFGTAANVLNPDVAYLTMKIPVRVALGCVFQTNKAAFHVTDNPAYRHYRNSRWIDSQVDQQAGNYYLRLKFPMRYTNGIEIILWDTGRNTRATNGWFSTAYEHGTDAPQYAGYFMRSTVYSNAVFGSVHSPVGTNNVLLCTNRGAGIFLGTCLSAGDSGDDSWMEGRMTLGFGDTTGLWQSSGVEDYFHNPFYFQFNTYIFDTAGAQGGIAGATGAIAQNIAYDFGSTYLAPNFSGAALNSKEAYRWFSEKDAPMWTNTMYFKYIYNTNAADGGLSIFDLVPSFQTISFYISPVP